MVQHPCGHGDGLCLPTDLSALTHQRGRIVESDPPTVLLQIVLLSKVVQAVRLDRFAFEHLPVRDEWVGR